MTISVRGRSQAKCGSREDTLLRRARREPERLTREVLSIRHAPPVQPTRTERHWRCPVEPTRNGKMTSVCAGHRLGGAPRRNRTGDPILTMEPPGTAVRTAVPAGYSRPSGPQLSVLPQCSYAFRVGLLRTASRRQI